METIRWPKGRTIDKFKELVRKNSHYFLRGRVVAIDPGSRSLGYAIFQDGKFIERNKIQVHGKLPLNTRLAQILKELPKEPQPDVLLVEEIGKGAMAHIYLKYAVGAVLAGYPYPVLIFCPITVWKAYARDTGLTDKDDDIDAEVMGTSVIHLAKELANEN